MEENVYNPVAQSNPPSNLSLLDIIKAFKNSNGLEFSTRLGDIGNLLSDSIEPLFENIQGSPYSNEELAEILNEFARQILLNKREIIYTKHLVALLTFELASQGIEVNNKELLEELKIYLAKK